MNYEPGQLVYFDKRWPPTTHVVRCSDVIEMSGNKLVTTCVGDALIIGVIPGPVRVEIQIAITGGKKSKKDSRGCALMLLLPDGQFGWIISDGSYPRVTSE